MALWQSPPSYANVLAMDQVSQSLVHSVVTSKTPPIPGKSAINHQPLLPKQRAHGRVWRRDWWQTSSKWITPVLFAFYTAWLTRRTDTRTFQPRNVDHGLTAEFLRGLLPRSPWSQRNFATPIGWGPEGTNKQTRQKEEKGRYCRNKNGRWTEW